VEEVPSEQHHVDILLFCEGHDFMEALPAVIASDGVSLSVADMAVTGNQDSYRISSYGILLARSAHDRRGQ